MADVSNIAKQFGSLPPAKLAALAGVLILVIASLVLSLAWLQKADHVPLFTNLSEGDAGRIAQKLNEMKVPYTTSSGGIMVPADKVYDLRLQLASQGLPQGGGVGFELFDETSFTMTDFVQKLNYRRALQGELSRTIRALAEVEQCRVHLAVPEKSLFNQKAERPKASVLVTLRPGRRLSQGQVRGIVHMVSSSVEGLDARDVTVVDSSGEMLTASTDESFTASGSQMEFQQDYEQKLEAKVASILEPVVGKGKVRVKVAATMDFTKVEKREEKYDPDSQVVRSEQRSIEKSSNQSGGGGGVPGVASNVPEKAGQQPSGGSQQNRASSEKKNETINYEISKITSHVVSPVGEVKRLSVVALVDGTYAAAEGTTDSKYVPRSEESIAQFEDMVKKSVGFNAQRGDEVKVVNMPFEAAVREDMLEPAGKEASSMAPVALMAGRYAAPLAVVLLLFFMVIKPLLRILGSSPAPSPVQVQIRDGAPVQLPQSVGEIERAMAKKELTARERLVDWAKTNPAEATNMVKGWLEGK